MIIASIIYYMQELNIWIAQVSDFFKKYIFFPFSLFLSFPKLLVVDFILL